MQLAKGNSALALAMTVISNLLGILIVSCICRWQHCKINLLSNYCVKWYCYSSLIFVCFCLDASFSLFAADTFFNLDIDSFRCWSISPSKAVVQKPCSYSLSSSYIRKGMPIDSKKLLHAEILKVQITVELAYWHSFCISFDVQGMILFLFWINR